MFYNPPVRTKKVEEDKEKNLPVKPAAAAQEVIIAEQNLGMPYWDKDVHAFPNCLARSSVFGIFSKRNATQILSSPELQKELYVHSKTMMSEKGVDIIYSGFLLSQEYSNVWSKLVDLCKEEQMDRWFFKKSQVMTFNELMHKLGYKHPNKVEIQLVKDQIEILTRAWLNIQITESRFDEETDKRIVIKRNYIGHLINNLLKVEVGGHIRFQIDIDPTIAHIFYDDGFGRLSKRVHDLLRRKKKYLAMWLHGYYNSHENTDKYLYSVRTIWERCGSRDETESNLKADLTEKQKDEKLKASLRSFRQNLKNALRELEAVTGWKCSINDDDCVEVIKPKKTKKVIEVEEVEVL